MSERYLVISSDCHAGLPNLEYRDYLESKYHDAFDDFMVQRTAIRTQGNIMGNTEFEEEWFGENEEGLRGAWNAARRDAELDGDGVAGEVIFPDADAVTGGASAPFGAGLGMSFAEDPELLLAGARAHNRWLADLCNDSPERRAGVAVVPIIADVDAAVAEIARARESGLRGGILIASMWNEGPGYHERRYDSIWAACQDLEMPVHTHSGAAPRSDYGTGPGFIGMYVAEVRWWTTRPLWFLLHSGVFERYPGLRYAITECGCFWAADLLWTMDSTYSREQGGAQKLAADAYSHLSLRPSDYFDRNCAIGAASTKRRELARRFEIGVGNIMWGNDFPHPEGTWPHTRKALAEAFWDIPADDTAAILGLNAAEFYGFDTEALAPLVDRIGPTPEELGQTDPAETSQKWEALAAAGRPWITGVEAVPISMD